MKNAQMTFNTPAGSYRWIENWITIPGGAQGRTDGRTHGVAICKNGEVVIFHQADPSVLIYSPDGTLLRSWGRFPGAHGLTLVQENGDEYLWLTDEVTKDVVKMTLDGREVFRLERPDHPAYAEADTYIPTWVAVAEDRFGGNGDIWVADGYGCSLVHRFDRMGRWIATLDGSEGAGRFVCPHGLALDTRRAEAEFYIADRGNRRFQVYGMDGKYRRSFGSDFLNSPDVSARLGEYLIVPELIAGITLLDSEDRPMTAIGFHSEADQQAGWPNDRRWVTPGRFNSPHSAAADASGNLYVVEWITGGRVVKLERM